MTTNDSKILIVDDEEAILFAFSKVLKRPDLEVQTAQTLQEGLDLLQKNAYRVVIADLRLSGAANNDGYEIVASAKAQQKQCKIVVMTAFGDDKTRDTVFGLGADYYLEKPVSPHKVKELLLSLGV